jgi:hypothetical protein
MTAVLFVCVVGVIALALVVDGCAFAFHMRDMLKGRGYLGSPHTRKTRQRASYWLLTSRRVHQHTTTDHQPEAHYAEQNKTSRESPGGLARHGFW